MAMTRTLVSRGPAVLLAAAFALPGPAPADRVPRPDRPAAIRSATIPPAAPVPAPTPPGPPGHSGNSLGGPDQWNSQATLIDAVQIEVDDAGRQWMAVQEQRYAEPSRIVVLYSDDGGDIWDSAFQITDPDTSYTSPSLHVANGTLNRVYLGYVNAATHQAFVAYRPADLSGPRETRRVFSGVLAGSIRITSDQENFTSYYLYAVVDHLLGWEIRFTRSLSYGEGWETGYAIATAPADVNYADPRVGYGLDGIVHAAWWVSDGDATDASVFYRRALSFASGGIASWQPAVDVAGNANGRVELYPDLLASTTGPDVLIAYTDGTGGYEENFLRVSHDHGETWAAGDSVSLGPGQRPALLQKPNLGQYAVAAIDGRTVPPGSGRFLVAAHADVSDPLDWGPYDDVGDFGRLKGGTTRPLDLDYDPTRADRFAIAWTDVFWGAVWDSSWSDAEWHAATPGTPYVEGGLPVVLFGTAAASHPALAEVDGDPELEAVFTTAAGDLRVMNPDGSLPWVPLPVDPPPGNPRAAAAVGDLDYDGRPELAVGSASGTVMVYHGDGSPAPGWPRDFGDGDAYVSIGPVLSPGSRQLAIACDGAIHVVTLGGAELPGFPVAGPAATPVAAPSIGDIDDDGSTDIVSAAGTRVMAYRRDGTLILDRAGLNPVTDAAALGDLDLDGDLEIAIPAVNAVYVMEHDGADHPGWPYALPGESASAVSLAQCRGTSALEVVFSTVGGVHMLDHNAGVYSGFPASLGGAYTLGGVCIQTIDEGSADLLTNAPDSSAFAFTNFGAAVAGWPKWIQAAGTLVPASADIDLDGSLEVVLVADHDVVILDVTASPANPANTRWPMYGYDAGRTHCFRCDFPSTVATPHRAEAGPGLLAPPAPNPTRGGTTLAYTVPARSPVRLEIFDAAGRLVEVLVKEEQPAGTYATAWRGTDASGRDAPSGVYFVRLRTYEDGRPAVSLRKVNLVR